MKINNLNNIIYYNLVYVKLINYLCILCDF